MQLNNFYTKGQSLLGIIIVLVVVGLLIGGLYYYLERQIPEVPEITEVEELEVVEEPPAEGSVVEPRPEPVVEPEPKPVVEPKPEPKPIVKPEPEMVAGSEPEPGPEPDPTPVVLKCVDGTIYGQCSANKPKYCDSGNLINKCITCSCPQNQECQPDGTCLENSWIFILTYRETPLSKEAVNLLCDELGPAVTSWIEREAAKHQKIKPFSNITCLQDQVLITGELLKGGLIFAEGQQFTNPIDNTGVISFLEDKFPFLISIKYITVFHYIPYDIQFVNYMYSKKYDFNFIKTPDPFIPFYPELTIDTYGTTLAHELMHKLGAADKYGYTSEQACLNNPTTGEPHNGYDIMCHRVASDGGLTVPTLSELIVSDPTAREVGWK